MLGGHLLRMCGDYVALLERGLASDAALDRLSAEPLEFDPILVEVLAPCAADERPSERSS